jgi:hypothetical protein
VTKWKDPARSVAARGRKKEKKEKKGKRDFGRGSIGFG